MQNHLSATLLAEFVATLASAPALRLWSGSAADSRDRRCA
jgi:hypothetical protein